MDERAADHAPERPFAKPSEAFVEPPAEARGAAPGGGRRRGERVAQMARQDQEAFHQAGYQRQHDDDRDFPDDLPDDAADQDQRQEGGDGGEARTEHRARHAPGPLHGRLQRVVAPACAGFGVFGHHDGVVHNETDGEDDPEKDYHINRVPERPCEGHGGQQGGGDAGGYPYRGAGIQEHEEDYQHDGHAAQPVADEQVDALVDQFRRFAIAVDRDAGRQGGHETLEELRGRLGGFERIGRRRPLDDQFDGRAPVEPDARLVLVPRLADIRDLAHRQPATVRERPHLDGGDLLGGARKPQRAHAGDRLPAGVAARYVARRARNAARDFRDRQVERQQVPLVGLDQDPLVARADGLDLVDTGPDEPVPHAQRPGLERALRQGPGKHDAQQVFVADHAPDPRRLAVFGQGGDARDGRIHVRQRRLHVGPGLEIDREAGAALLGGGNHPLHTVEEPDLGLDRLDDGVVHILRPGTRPRHRDDDRVDAEIGEELLVHPRERQQPDDQHRRHQQVRRRRVAREQRDHGTCTLTPGAISGKRVSTMRWPSSSGPCTSRLSPSLARTATSTASSRSSAPMR